MNVYRFLKQLKKRLRWKRSWLTLGMFVLVVAITWIVTGHLEQSNSRVATRATIAGLAPEDDARLQEATKLLQAISDRRESYLLKSYVCGEERSPLGSHTSQELLALQKQHPSWLLSIKDSGEVVFTDNIDDLSPTCKEKAVFGIDGSSNLSLFNGTPANNQIIRTFFQLNIQQLESSLPTDTVAQLHEGIRVTDIEEYNSVLSTFSDYAMEVTEGAMSRP
ncbi:BofC C-terminal domain-containing protein [Paenibacillus qinlingensis]|uniref:Forespore regulator of the sigma-K checkpoint n=1 Tax=Paenibacillus qinlingensis TaxID=1837343 RepID=A0ABU1P717_9BACL|nr:BofC C-terminal domain-containing protein [Paenibacillus qinlingensis]MDR6555564.1 forespore regulator of the sigma-K checkpoint [Paenibacillus qinlingensis]